ncbi:hydroxymethylglutaryl-CoA lyase [Pseudooceanicola sediminis]|uniref:Hydroxymethylglutaryl-CoA lyase n=1 Tax=Pseudooceanicola sediminis TaxID=2211117 RepID=A0A399J5T7_9RHOB|nr:hydroxymethylglutaryl-CoA lyase [Pseudooceanicola sediminis]KAA2317105.1 hydroxymethylglutaryl-CoA lyase [Puniceibacterium sp. HSS470]RII40550.1 hydroxymethylglutaryl-CoA lyase [Pseudooceanicola sediminis]
MSDTITVFEVGPRDGLQSLGVQVATATKIALIDALARAGLRKIEATSFVSPRWVPQMADAGDVMAGINRQQGVTYAALTPNERGLDLALAAGCDEIAIFASASEGFSHANLNCSIEESFARFAPVMQRSAEAGLPVRGYLSAVIACPYDGPTPPAQVHRWAERLLEIGCYEVSLGDTIGAGTPDTLGNVLKPLLHDIPADRLAGHFHDTNGLAGDLVVRALDLGLRTFDASVGGLGGCPYAPGAPGNIDTRKVLECAAALGFSHGVDLALLGDAEQIAMSIAAR